ncbi:MAG: hypothetical protein KTR20_06075 [Cellvibrionaceae bacterium]|nr:hypothetical protein [Cellvibrionaceae bacterium]
MTEPSVSGHNYFKVPQQKPPSPAFTAAPVTPGSSSAPLPKQKPLKGSLPLDDGRLGCYEALKRRLSKPPSCGAATTKVLPEDGGLSRRQIIKRNIQAKKAFDAARETEQKAAYAAATADGVKSSTEGRYLTADDIEKVTTFLALAERMGLNKQQKKGWLRILFNRPGTQMDYLRGGKMKRGRGGFELFPQRGVHALKSILQDHQDGGVRKQSSNGMLLAELIKKYPRLAALQAEELGTDIFGQLADVLKQFSQQLKQPESVLNEVLAQCLDPACMPLIYPTGIDERVARELVMQARASDTDITAPHNQTLQQMVDVICSLEADQTVGLKHYGRKGWGLAAFVPFPYSPFLNTVAELKPCDRARYLDASFSGTQGDNVIFSLSLNKAVIFQLVAGLVSVAYTLTGGSPHEELFKHFDQVWAIAVAFLGGSRSKTFDLSTRVSKSDVPEFFQALVDGDIARIVDLSGPPTFKLGRGGTVESKAILQAMVRNILSAAHGHQRLERGGGYWMRTEEGISIDLLHAQWGRFVEKTVTGEGEVINKGDKKWRLEKFVLFALKLFFREMLTIILPSVFYSLEQSPTDTRSDPRGHPDRVDGKIRTKIVDSVEQLYTKKGPPCVKKYPWKKELKQAIEDCPALAQEIETMKEDAKTGDVHFEVKIKGDKVVEIIRVKRVEKTRNQLLILFIYDHKSAKSMYVETRRRTFILRDGAGKIIGVDNKMPQARPNRPADVKPADRRADTSTAGEGKEEEEDESDHLLPAAEVKPRVRFNLPVKPSGSTTPGSGSHTSPVVQRERYTKMSLAEEEMFNYSQWRRQTYKFADD